MLRGRLLVYLLVLSVVCFSCKERCGTIGVTPLFHPLLCPFFLKAINSNINYVDVYVFKCIWNLESVMPWQELFSYTSNGSNNT